MEELAAEVSGLNISGSGAASSPPSGGSSLSGLCYDADSLQELARQGSWRSLLEKIDRARKLSLLKAPHEHLAYHAFSVLALAKIRKFQEASDEIEGLGDLNAEKYRYEAYPEHYHGKLGSMVPFSLRWLHAQLPERLGNRQETVDRLYLLLDFVRKKLKSFSDRGELSAKSCSVDGSHGTAVISESDEATGGRIELSGKSSDAGDGADEPKLPGSDGGIIEDSSPGVNQDAPEASKNTGGFPSEMAAESHGESTSAGDEFGEWKSAVADESIDAATVCRQLWQRRETIVISTIISHHLSQKEFDACIALLHHLLRQNPSDPVLLAKVGYVQMQLGDLNGATATFAHIESLSKSGSSNQLMDEMKLKNLVNRNRALVYLVAKDYASAIREYEEAIERDPTDMIAINNKALCLMYSRDLSDSIKVLESALERMPSVALDETVVVNLCSMYELAYVNHSEIKKTLSNWIARVAPDDFDSSCIRM
ncbi:Trafficking protein particle complex subunit 12 [Nymphaea thermarum]|nr:Trafficking protein particle complex subunit 12 [Nymphaea thermarum]